MTAVLPISAPPTAIPQEEARHGRWRRMPAKAKVGAILLGLFVLVGIIGPFAEAITIADGAQVAIAAALGAAANAVAVTPRGAGVYVTSLFSNSVTAFTPAETGTGLTQMEGTAGCLVYLRAVGCSFGRAMVAPEAAAENLRRLTDVGARGSYGFYEALDYTGSRVPEGATVAIVRAYMAHHQGMTLVALSNVLREGGMPARFHAEPIIQATELLLQERPPRDVAVARPRAEVSPPAELRRVGSYSCAARGCHGAVGPTSPATGDVFIKDGASTTCRYFDPHNR